ncbi:5-formyltetrahydrofolate cyclo-ligase [Mechercharimyces sp. CAU 1602]|uniref:5-formyltetrahydrofolate cyclo-ligase n=1 Tax=Mechercharimyces sp. CAU 1602 TaxID=2973933 RepID=UPI00216349A9|nr:5-formyltetrahydrofolate cyclo-ligase [Mechercharimyces sp. CAU 1602]MCS1352118.1 5-formyltetrahydrofolate cyclo-ligase [Mechercharimyces sp. CAU 1602]
MQLKKDKRALRRQMRERRNQMEKQEAKKGSHAVCMHLLESPEYEEAQTILYYMSFRQEVDLCVAIERSWEDGKKVVLPRTDPLNKKMILYSLTDFTQLEEGAYGIWEPSARAENKVAPDLVELAIVPGLAFDQQGFRLGYGGGYYDRFFAEDLPLDCIRMGAAYPWQIVETVYAESHDEPLHQVLTSEGVFQYHKLPFIHKSSP